jgi:hypothetical protein
MSLSHITDVLIPFQSHLCHLISINYYSHIYYNNSIVSKCSGDLHLKALNFVFDLHLKALNFRVPPTCLLLYFLL